jgi:hypothetical protein
MLLPIPSAIIPNFPDASVAIAGCLNCIQAFKHFYHRNENMFNREYKA